TLNFEPVSPTPVADFSASFYSRIGSGPGGSGQGHSFVVHDADAYATDTLLDSLGFPPSGQSIDGITVMFGGILGVNEIQVRYGSTTVGQFTPPYDIHDNAWRRYSLEVTDGWLTLSVEALDGIPTELLHVELPNFTPFRARYGFGTSASHFSGSVAIDQVHFIDRTGAFDRDINGNGVLDSCESQTSQQIRLGTPANPEALGFGAADGPTMGSVYAPQIDHSSFMPGAQLDYLFVSLESSNLPLPPFGTVLTGLSPIATLTQPASQLFQVPMPVSATLLSTPVTFQGASIDFAAGGGSEVAIELTNAIDAVVGAWSPLN
ncbi:MAG: hypothetical protein AAFY46_12520, partial [Planctomycetota bacterium]